MQSIQNIIDQWSFQLGITDVQLYIALGVLLSLVILLPIVWKLKRTSSKKVSSKEAATEKVQESAKAIATKKVETVSFSQRLSKGLSKTRNEVWGKVAGLLSGTQIDEESYEQVEEILYTSDMPPNLVNDILESLKKAVKEQGEMTPEALLGSVHKMIQESMEGIQQNVSSGLYEVAPNKGELKVIMVVGVNGAGKTTTIGKLATKLKSQGAKVVVGACDTFRAAAVEQLEVWCKRADVEMVRAAEGADPSGVAYDAVAKAKELGADYCIIDTAGRLHTKSNLMDELTKTKKVMSKVVADAPHETLLVIDAITGQNALRQAEEFNKALTLTGLIFTKCDGSAKAGSAVGIVQRLNVPIVYIGVGENVEDLDKFELNDYLQALLGV